MKSAVSTLAAYAPLRYVLPHKQAAYDTKYSTRLHGGQRMFRQADREESLIHLLRVNILKRMESAVTSFASTIKRQLDDVTAMLARLDAHDASVDEISIEDIEVDDPAFETLLIGREVKVRREDVDRVRWRQDFIPWYVTGSTHCCRRRGMLSGVRLQQPTPAARTD